MTYRGHMENGVVVLDEPAALPEGTRVYVELAAQDVPEPPATTLHDALGPFEGAFADLPSDFAQNHDHYLHGAPKRR